MSIAYLVLAHSNPRHLARLVSRLSTPSSRVFIHIDRKTSLRPFSESVPIGRAEFVEPRLDVRWGRFSMVAATLLLLKRALSHPDRFDRFVLLSGSDYPLRSAESIERFFRTHREVEFINAAPLPNHLAGRLKKYRPESPRWLRASVRVLDTVGLAPRRDYGRVLGPLVPHKGSQWWALSREAVERVIRFEVEQPEVTKFFTCTHCPDETYFHTIIANTRPTLPLQPAVTFADWRRGGSSPAWLTMDHVAEIRRTHRFDSGNPGHPMLFVRKCPDPSDAVVTAIDEMISAKDGQTSS